MIVGVVHVLVGGVVVDESSQCLLTERKVVELVLENDATVVETIHDNHVAGLFGIFAEWDVFKVVCALMRVVFGLLAFFFFSFLGFLRLHQRVALLVGQLCFIGGGTGHYRLVVALPVVGVLTFTPQLLKLLLALCDSQLVVEVPVLGLLVDCRHGLLGFVGRLVRRVLTELALSCLLCL